MWDLPRPGIEPVSPALAGRFLTTVPPGKSLSTSFCLNMFSVLLRMYLEAELQGHMAIPCSSYGGTAKPCFHSAPLFIFHTATKVTSLKFKTDHVTIPLKTLQRLPISLGIKSKLIIVTYILWSLPLFPMHLLTLCLHF